MGVARKLQFFFGLATYGPAAGYIWWQHERSPLFRPSTIHYRSFQRQKFI